MNIDRDDMINLFEDIKDFVFHLDNWEKVNNVDLVIAQFLENLKEDY